MSKILDRVTVVCGFPRSGTSLTMQILEKACMRCAGEFPAFEPEECLDPTSEFVASMKGGALKILDPFFLSLPRDLDYNFIFMKRNKSEQTQSNFKFMIAVGMPVGATPANMAKFKKSLERDEPKALRALSKNHPGSDILEMDFEKLIDEPLSAVSQIAAFLGIDSLIYVDALARCVQKRNSSCLSYMLELSQINP